MMSSEYARAGETLPYFFIDSITLFKNKYPGLERSSLDCLSSYFGIEKNGNEDVGDAVALYKVFAAADLYNELNYVLETKFTKDNKAA